MVQLRDDVVGLDAAILSPPAVWAASGHLATFTDPLVDCRNCHERWREDKIDGVCPNCGSRDLTEARAFNLMFKTHAGPVEDEGHVAYLRPETAQGMFVNFANVLNTTRKKPPFGIAQVGKSFRNEITPQNFVFRTREFEQMEMEYFVPPAESQQWFEYWLAERFRWYLELGIPEDKLRLRHHEKSELSHYFVVAVGIRALIRKRREEVLQPGSRAPCAVQATRNPDRGREQRPSRSRFVRVECARWSWAEEHAASFRRKRSVKGRWWSRNWAGPPGCGCHLPTDG